MKQAYNVTMKPDISNDMHFFVIFPFKSYLPPPPCARAPMAGHLREVFRKIDVDGNGSISVDELREVVQNEGANYV